MNTSRYRREILISSKHALVIAFFNFLIFLSSITPFLHSSIPSLFHYSIPSSSILPFLNPPFFHFFFFILTFYVVVFFHSWLLFNARHSCLVWPTEAGMRALLQSKWGTCMLALCVVYWCYNQSEAHVWLPFVYVPRNQLVTALLWSPPIWQGVAPPILTHWTEKLKTVYSFLE